MTGRLSSDVDWIAARLGWRCRDAALVATALTHRSVGSTHNERLEFLGDAVLSLVVAERLYQEFPAASEGELSRYRASLVSGESLADIAETLELGERLRLGPGELHSGGFRRRSTLADAFEALLGAIYLDGGMPALRQVLEPLLAPRVAGLRQMPAVKDAKTRLQEYLQGRALPLPHYTVETITGEPHEQTFTVLCTIAGEARSAEGIGTSRRRAEQMAAEELLALLEAGTGGS
ncbi:MAG TPA: ribonuclease III [Steroidobacteraceae bacterium]|nr:ribonuclease III [Steroidobacteraceae bacterium]